MESYFGADFSNVRVLLCDQPRLLGAKAFTLGNDIFIDPASYDPNSAAGRELLAHELTHVLQQRSGRATRSSLSGGLTETAVLDDPLLEAEAAFMGALASSVKPAPPGLRAPRGPMTQRATEGTGIPTGVVQMARFSSDGTALGRLGGQIYRYYDTENVEIFRRWTDYLQVNDAKHTLQRIQQGLAGLRPGTRGERIGASRVRRALDVLEWEAPKDVGSPLARLPRRSWWKLFIEGRYHHEPNGPLYFDLDQSPGFYDTMMRAFEQELMLVPNKGEKLTFNDYDRLHRLVVDGVLRLDGNAFEPVPHVRSDQWTIFPMTKPPHKPNPVGLFEMELEGVLGSSTEVIPGKYTSIYTENTTKDGSQWVIKTNYEQRDVPVKVNRLFKQYYEEITRIALSRKSLDDLRCYRQERTMASSSSIGVVGYLKNWFIGDSSNSENENSQLKQKEDEQKDDRREVLRAIVTLIRALHVGHFYVDANGRLNTVLLLNKLLLQNGFNPVIISDNAIFGGRMSVEQLVDAVENGLTTFQQEVVDAQQESRPKVVQGEVEASASVLRWLAEYGYQCKLYVLGGVVAYYAWPS